MTTPRASHGLRDTRRRRSLTQVRRLLEQLHQEPEAGAMTTDDALALREQIRQEAEGRQPILPLSLIPRKDSPS
jgi:hypothetical protein